jgi:ferredoxin-NADP reductase
VSCPGSEPREPIRRIPALRRTLVVESAAMLSETVRHLVLRTADGAPYDFLAGQWVKLYLPGDLARDYSLAAPPSPARPDRLEVIVTRVEGGPGSGALHALAPGAQVDSLGPSGLFVREAHHVPVPALYVGTGTGLAPLRAMLLEELARPSDVPQTLLFGVRTETDVLFDAEMRALAARHPRFRFEPTLSRGGASWTGRRGWVQTHLRELATPGAHVYVCGLGKMIDDVRRVVRQELGFDRRLVHSERYD